MGRNSGSSDGRGRSNQKKRCILLLFLNRTLESPARPLASFAMRARKKQAAKSAIVLADKPSGFSARSFLGLPVTLSSVVRTCRVLLVLTAEPRCGRGILTFGLRATAEREVPRCLDLLSQFKFAPNFARQHRGCASSKSHRCAFYPKFRAQRQLHAISWWVGRAPSHPSSFRGR